MSSLLGGKQKTSSTQTTTRNVPDWVLDSLQTAMSMGDEYATQAYEAYTGQRYADLSSDELAAIDTIRNSQGIWTDAYTNSSNVL